MSEAVFELGISLIEWVQGASKRPERIKYLEDSISTDLFLNV